MVRPQKVAARSTKEAPLPKPEKEKRTTNSVRDRIRSLFLENIGVVLTRHEILAAAKDPKTGIEPENWHQRLSELRTDEGYRILTNRDDRDLRPGQYRLDSPDRNPTSKKRCLPTPATWIKIQEKYGNKCAWNEDGIDCNLAEGHIDHIGGGTVHLTPDHMTPHSVNPDADPKDVDAWRPLCGRHQVMKKNFWDNTTGKVNVIAVIQASSAEQKSEAFVWLSEYFKEKPVKGATNEK